MTKTVWEWVIERVLDRIGTLLAGSFATTAEARLIRSQAETLRELEALADQYDRQGKGQLAQMVRQQAARLTLTSAGESAASILANLSQDDRRNNELLGLPTPQPAPAPLSTNRTQPLRTSSTTTGRRRGRPPKRPAAPAE